MRRRIGFIKACVEQGANSVCSSARNLSSIRAKAPMKSTGWPFNSTHSGCAKNLLSSCRSCHQRALEEILARELLILVHRVLSSPRSKMFVSGPVGISGFEEGDFEGDSSLEKVEVKQARSR